MSSLAATRTKRAVRAKAVKYDEEYHSDEEEEVIAPAPAKGRKRAATKAPAKRVAKKKKAEEDDEEASVGALRIANCKLQSFPVSCECLI